MTNNMYRQGDLLFITVPGLPEGLTSQPNLVIAQGKVTGSRHCLLSGRVLEDRQGALFLETLHATQIIHQEHRPLDLLAGCYRVIQQREYAPEAIREVID